MKTTETPDTMPMRRRAPRAADPAAAPSAGDGSDRFAAEQAKATPERDASARLAHVMGERELFATLLALLLPPGSRRALAAWRLETAGIVDAEALREHATQLSGAARLPWFERLLDRMALHRVRHRQALLLATRRLMGARSIARPIDRLHWLTMRRGLGEVPPLAARALAVAAGGELDAHWLESDVVAIAAYTAFLSRMVPSDAPGDDGSRWYDAAMTTWRAATTADLPPCRPPPAEAMVEALGRLQTLSWMQRPQLVRAWLGAATLQTRGGRLADGAADALAMSCGLLDTPMPPELARHYVALPPDPRRD